MCRVPYNLSLVINKIEMTFSQQQLWIQRASPDREFITKTPPPPPLYHKDTVNTARKTIVRIYKPFCPILVTRSGNLGTNGADVWTDGTGVVWSFMLSAGWKRRENKNLKLRTRLSSYIYIYICIYYNLIYIYHLYPLRRLTH